MAKKNQAEPENLDEEDDEDSAEFKKRFGKINVDKKGRNSPLPFLSADASAMGVRDEDELKAMSEIARGLFNFPADKIFSWSRWRKWEIPKIAATLVRAIANSPDRPKNEDGTLERLSVLYIKITGWLRLAEEGAMRNEAMGALRPQTEEMKMSADKWSDSQ